MTETETWRTVDGFPMYEVSDQGRIRSWIDHMGRDLPHVLEGGLNSRGRRHVILVSADKRQTFPIHCLVASAFLGPRPAGMHVCHNDSDHLNNAAANLRYDTVAGNIADQLAAGTHYSQVQAAKTHCPHGHPYDDENTYVYTNRNGREQRFCRACQRAKNRRQAARRRARRLASISESAA